MRIAVLVLLSTVAVARADESRDVWAHTHLAVAAHLGIGDPFGDAGLELEITPVRWLSVAAGGGGGRAVPLGNSGTYSIAAMVRGRVPITEHWDGLAGLGFSRGDWTEEDHPFGESPYSATRWDQVSYVDGELGIEHHWRHIEVRLYAGKSGVHSLHGYSCQVLRSDGNCSMSVRPSSPGFIGFALGYAFSL